MAKIGEQDIINVICNALNINKKKATINTRMKDIEEWDSLGHLGILASLDRFFKGKIAPIKEMAAADSIKKIIQILKDKELI